MADWESCIQSYMRIRRIKSMKNSSNTFCAGCEPDEDEALPHLQIRIPLPTSINATESPERISGPALRRAREGFSDGREVERRQDRPDTWRPTRGEGHAHQR